MPLPAPARIGPIGIVAVAATLVIVAGCRRDEAPAPPPRTRLAIGVASSLIDVAREAVDRFALLEPSLRIDLSVGATGRLVMQVEAGAPLDAVITAAPAWMDRLVAAGMVRAEDRRPLAGNALVVIAPTEGPPAPMTLDGLLAPAYARIAIGRPETAPVGRFARDALEAEGLWPRIEPRLVPCATARQVLAYVARGEVDAGIAFATDAGASEGAVRVGAVVDLPGATCEAAPLAGSPRAGAAGRFVSFLAGPEGRAILEGHGFRVE